MTKAWWGVAMACLFAAAGATAVLAQGSRDPGEGDWGRPPSVQPPEGSRPVSPPANPVKSLLLNPLVASSLNLTPQQMAALGTLDEEMTKEALMVAFLTRILQGLVADPVLAAHVGLRPEQIARAQTAITPALVRRAFSIAQLEQLMRSVLAPEMKGRVGAGPMSGPPRREPPR
jgi:hypothetical protein